MYEGGGRTCGARSWWVLVCKYCFVCSWYSIGIMMQVSCGNLICKQKSVQQQYLATALCRMRLHNSMVLCEVAQQHGVCMRLQGIHYKQDKSFLFLLAFLANVSDIYMTT